MTLAEFEALLKRHDWLYFMAEGNAYWRGKQSSERVEAARQAMAAGLDADAAAQLYNEYVKRGEIVW
jgi:hypothetical protein